jgi:putative transcriptional regulator
MSTVRVTLDAANRVKGRIDRRRVDATTEADIQRQAAEDAAASAQDAAAYTRRVRRRTGLTQAAFASRIGVPLDTVRNWEQGKRLPAGPAKALLKILDRAPEAALSALA